MLSPGVRNQSFAFRPSHMNLPIRTSMMQFVSEQMLSPTLPSPWTNGVIRNGETSLFSLPVNGCVPSALVWGDGRLRRCGGGPGVPSAANHLVSGGPQRGLQKALSWSSPGGVGFTARVNSKNAVRWPATRWRCSLSAPTRRIRTSVRSSRSTRTRGGAC